MSAVDLARLWNANASEDPTSVNGAAVRATAGAANSAFHLTAGLAFARPPAGECERSPHLGNDQPGGAFSRCVGTEPGGG
jgi:hypothetical protein